MASIFGSHLPSIRFCHTHTQGSREQGVRLIANLVQIVDLFKEGYGLEEVAPTNLGSIQPSVPISIDDIKYAANHLQAPPKKERKRKRARERGGR